MKVAIIGKGIMGKQLYEYLLNYVEVNIFHHNDDFEQLENYDLIIECIIENIYAKNNLFKKLDKICDKDTLFASNTSSLLIEDMQCENRPVIGIHFMNPVKKIDTIELIYPKKITNIQMLKIMNFLDKIHKKYFIVSDTKGFVVNKLLITLIHEALKLTEKEEPKTIDNLMFNCCKFPIGPLKLGDIIGWDVILNICNNIEIIPCKQLKDLVMNNHLGCKTKQGIYSYL